MKRPGDENPPPPGGRAAERLREFEAARADPDKKPEQQDNAQQDETGSDPTCEGSD